MERLGYGVKSSDELLSGNTSQLGELPFGASDSQEALMSNERGVF